MLQDLRLAFRAFLRSPLHTVTVVLILAIGIGANTAIFSLVHSVLLKPLPYPEPDRITLLQQQQRGTMDSPFSWPNIQDLKRDNRSFDAVGIFTRQTFTFSGHGPAEQTSGGAVSADFFRVLRIDPLLGRVFTGTDDVPGAPKVVVLRESFWRRKLGADPAILGQSIVLNAQPYQIIGVLPNAVINPSGTEFWVPVAPFADNDDWRNRRNQPGIFALGRLKDGITIEQARADLLSVGQRLQRDFPAENTNILPITRPLMEVVTGTYRSSLTMLMAAVALLLLIACANVAGLQLVRGFARAQEFSIRAALGAGRGPLVRLLLAESLALSLLGGALGVLLAFWSIDGIRALLPPLPRFQALAVDQVVLGFSVALSLAVGIVSGLWPAWRASRVDLREALQAGGQKGVIGGASQLTRQAMVTLQVALTVVLLAGAGLFARSLQKIAQFEYGFDSSNLLLVNVSLPDVPGRYDTDAKRIAFFEQARERVSVLPGVRSVGLNYSAPLRMDWSQIFDVDGRPPYPAGQEPIMQMGIIDPNYFPTLGLRVLKGRNFDASDKYDGTHTMIIDQRMAEALWPGEDPIGKVVLRGNRGRPIAERRTTIVGVVPTIQVDGFADGPRQFQAYLPQSQAGNDSLHFIIRTNVTPRSLVDSVRSAIAAQDPNVPAYSIATMDELIAQESGSQRLYSLLVSLFAGVALLLAALGLYGVVTHAVGARRREIGIRMALGALSRQVVTLMLRQGAGPLLLGLALGLVSSLAAGRFIASLLYHVSPYDPVTLLLAPIVLALVGLFALWLPARRAARIDPTVALRAE